MHWRTARVRRSADDVRTRARGRSRPRHHEIDAAKLGGLVADASIMHAVIAGTGTIKHRNGCERLRSVHGLRCVSRLYPDLAVLCERERVGPCPRRCSWPSRASTPGTGCRLRTRPSAVPTRHPAPCRSLHNRRTDRRNTDESQRAPSPPLPHQYRDHGTSIRPRKIADLHAAAQERGSVGGVASVLVVCLLERVSVAIGVDEHRPPSEVHLCRLRYELHAGRCEFLMGRDDIVACEEER